MKKTLAISVFALVVIALVSFVFVTSNPTVADKELPFDDKDPDIPAMLKQVKGQFTRKEFHLKRMEGVALKRGIYKDVPFDPSLRPKAIDELEKKQEEIRKMPDSPEKNALLVAWTPLGPAPIPNGQTTTNSVPVSGRTTAIAIHPTNPNIVYVGTAQGGLYRTTDGGTNWTPLMDSADSLAIGSLAIAPSSPDTLYVGTGEPNFSADSFFGVGLYRIDNASTGTPTLNGPFGGPQLAGRAISEIIVHPTVPGTIFLGTTSGVGGLRPVGPTAPPQAGLFRSTNATSGSPTFAKAFAGSFNVRDLAIDPTNPDILLATFVGTGVIRFPNATTTFAGATFPLNFGSAGEITSQRSGGAPNATFYVVEGAGNGRIHRSTDGGVTWSIQATNGFCSGQCFYNLAVAVDPTNPANVYIGGQANGFGLITGRSTNSGVSFTTVNFELHADTHAIEVAPSDPTQVWTGNDGGIWKSTNSGASYTSMNNTQFSATQFMSLDVHPSDANFSIGGTQDNGTNWYQPAGTWTRADFGDGGYAQIDQNAADTTNVRMYHTYFNVTNLQGYGTVNNTANAQDGLWTFRGCQVGGTTVNGITCNGAVNFYAPLERGPGTPNTIYYGSDRLYRSSNEGVNHTVVSQNPISAGVPISSIGIAPQDDNVRMVGLNNGELWGTSTGSSTLLDLDPGNAIPNVPIARTVVDPTSPTTAYVTLSRFGSPNVYKTTNLNALASGLAPTWTAAATGLPSVPINAIVIDPSNSNIVYVGTDIGVFVSSDGGTTWNPLGTALPRVAVFGIAITNAAPRQVRIATHGKGMFQHPALAPTAASASVSGRVVSAFGRGIPRAVVSVTDQSGQLRTAITNHFGYYQIEDIPVGETYTFTVSHKQYSFTPRVVNVDDNMENFNLVASPIKQ